MWCPGTRKSIKEIDKLNLEPTTYMHLIIGFSIETNDGKHVFKSILESISH